MRDLNSELDQLCVDAIRVLSIDAVEKAKSGHPGMPMGMADAAYVLWTQFLKHDPKHPKWYNRDRFILSAGHGSMLLYSLLFLTGYELPLKELKNFRQWGSKTPGHPEYGVTPGVETTTGPLGQGLGTGVGMAMAEAHLAEKFNTKDFNLTDHFTYGIVSDGDLMEGISHEAASLAGHLKLGKLIYLYDSNRISIDGSTELAFSEDIIKRFEGYNWHVKEINGHDRKAVKKAISAARETQNHPSLIICRTHIGYGSPNKQGTEEAHGKPLGEEEVRRTKQRLGWDPDKKFQLPEEVLEHMRQAVDKGKKRYKRWQEVFESYREEYPENAKIITSNNLRDYYYQLEKVLPVFESDEKGMATRSASNKVINAIESTIPWMMGGSADLTGSNKTWINTSKAYRKAEYQARNIHFGVREHAMVAAVNGMTLHGGVRSYGGTFLIFSDYCRPAIRIAALSEIPSIFVFTHDSVGLGEDGPTHQPVEHLASLRAMPNMWVIRPADANEVSWAWKVAMEHKSGPTSIVLTRQDIPIFDRSILVSAKDLQKGAYVLSDSEKNNPDIILIATGSEVHLALEAQEKLHSRNIQARVVSMPCWELFEQQSEEYQEWILPSKVKHRISIEAAATLGWDKWIGKEGVSIGVNRFGISAPYKEIYQHLGITADRIVRESRRILNDF